MFGVHLVLIGVLVYRSQVVSKILGVVLVLAGVAYGLDTFAHIALADYERFSGWFTAGVALPSMIGEVWLGVWLALTNRFD